MKLSVVGQSLGGYPHTVAFSVDDGVGQLAAEFTTVGYADDVAAPTTAHASTSILTESPANQPSHRFPCFDGLRAAAALAVLVLHTSYWSGFTTHSGIGNYVGRLEIGVAVFFLISGFLLYRPFALAHLTDRPAPSATRFWYRRLLRLVPAYWVALTMITYVFRDVTLGHGWQGVVANYGFAQIYFPGQIFNGITQAWSLCTEMTFYLFVPLYAAAIGLRRRSQSGQLQREIRGLVVLVAISFSFRNWALHQPVSCAPNCFARPAEVSLMSSWLPSYFDLFALGMLLAVLSAWYSERGTEPRFLSHPLFPWLSWAIAAVTYWIVSNIHIGMTPIYYISPSLNLVKQSLYGVFAFFLILPAVFGPQHQGLIRRLLRARVVVALGVISYGIYLWHVAWIAEFLKWTNYRDFRVPYLFMLGSVFGLSIVAATVSYLVFEIPALRMKDRTFRWRRRPEDPLVASPLLMAPTLAALEAGSVMGPGKVARLVALSRLHQAGELTDTEFELLKAEVINAPEPSAELSPQRQLGRGD